MKSKDITMRILNVLNVSNVKLKNAEKKNGVKNRNVKRKKGETDDI
jgi:hypothetical protein